MPADHLIRNLARVARRRIALLACSSLVLVALVVIMPVPGWLKVGLALAIVATAAAWREHWAGQLGPHHIARYLDFRYPLLEDSSELLIRPPTSVMERLQQARLVDRLGQLSPRPVAPVPRRALHSAFWLFLTFSLVLVLAWWLTTGASHRQAPGGSARQSLQLVAVTIQPPAYTRLPTLQQYEYDLVVAQDSVVSWRFRVPDDALNLQWSADNGQQLAAVSRGDGTVEFEFGIDSDLAYRLTWRQQNEERQTPFHTVRMLRDQAPQLTVESPDQSPLVIRSGQPPEARFVLLAQDDYGLGEAQVLATVASGSGENVRFREVAFAFDQAINTGAGRRYEQRWNLPELGMEPGDELYFQAVVSDRRQPAANTTRTAMLMVRWQSDEPTQTLAIDGIAVDLLPEYFRSQRQIIIDTERLLADQANISAAEGFRRSHNLALDQKSLRLRYGQYLGEEYSSDIGFSAPQPGALTAGHEAESFAEHMGHATDHHEHALDDSEAVSASIGALPDFMADFVHSHDSALQATLFDQKTRDTLKAALAAMWDSELQLHLRQPALALPHENTALDLLKQVQQANRIYVRRAGFEPPPLDEGKRLSGELDEVTDSRQRMQLEQAASRWQDLWQRLEAAGSGQLRPELAQSLLRLANESATPEAALEVRVTLARLSAGEPCAKCVAALQRFLWQQAPPPDAVASKPVSGPEAALQAGYQQQLETAW